MLVHYAVDRAIATITLDSPANRNALSTQLVTELRGHLDAAAADETSGRSSSPTPAACSAPAPT